MQLNKYLLLLLIFSVGFGQITTGKIKPVVSTGMYKIMLAPELKSAAQQNLQDLRIYNQNKNEVPYFIVEDNAKVQQSFKIYPIVKKTSTPNKSTTYIIENPAVEKLNQFALTVGNSDVIKYYNLSGSANKTNWYGISNNGTLHQLSSEKTTTVSKTITFPLSSYRYFRITFNDSLSLPINLLRVGNLSQQTAPRKLITIPATIESKELPTEKKTQIHVRFNHKQVINQINFNITGPTLYQRTVTIYKFSKRQKRKRTETFKEILNQFTLASNAKNQIEIGSLFESEFFIEIDNRDNPPLNMPDVQLLQWPTFAIAELQAGQQYAIETGNEKLGMPDYDIASIINVNPDILPEVAITNIKATLPKLEAEKSISFWQQKWFLWLCIALGGLAIAIFTVSLIRDLKNNPSSRE